MKLTTRLSRKIHSGLCLFSLVLGLHPVSTLAQTRPTPPPVPRIPPFIAERYPTDADEDRIEDQLSARVQAAEAAHARASSASEKSAAQRGLDESVEVELIFKQQITQQQMDGFLSRGGEFTHVYEALSYGWNGRLPLGKIRALPAVMGDALVLVEEAKPAVLHLDSATRTGRVRPVWAAGFANNPAGYDGDPNITIGILDTGVDESHMDLNGRRVFWQDYSSDGFASPQDVIQHGSHVSGIALGTGAAGGNGTGNLLYTDESSLAGVSSGSFFPNPINLPSSSITVSATATFQGFGTTTLYLLYHTKGTASGWTVQGSGVTGASPLNLNLTFTPLATRAYSVSLLSNGTMSNYVVTVSAPGFAAIGDGFNKLRGVAPDCKWAGAKVFSNAGSGSSASINAGLDGLVANRVANNIKAINISLGIIGDPGISATQRQKVNTAVNNGIVVVCSAGNDGGKSTAAQREIDDPGRAALAITVAASDDNNQLTDYTSIGFSVPGSVAGQEEDFKPDVMAPGGSASYYSSIMSVDSNTQDGAFADQRTNDYYNIQGTSMAAPFVTGSSALIIDALQQSGTNWDFNSSQHPRLVKMLLCATTTESNATRDSNANNPTLQRATAGPSSFPVGKDPYEGYGMINPDAAIEAVALSYTNFSTATALLGSTVNDRRAWARSVSLPGGANFSAVLSVPGTGDFDLYLYSRTPSAYGTPVILASSTGAGNGLTETITYTPATATNAILVVKRISGSGTFSFLAGGTPTATFTGTPTNGATPLQVVFTNVTVGATNYSWTFGDGNTSSAVNPTNAYATPGTFTVTLLASGVGGTNTLVRTAYITATNPPPPPVIANFAGTPTNGYAPLAVTFTNYSSGATNYAWGFGDGKTSANTNASNTYSNAGTYSVTLMAVGLAGTNIVTATNYITVTNYPAPVASFVADITNGVVPLLVNFTNLSANATTFLWTFGDGNTSSAANPSNTYSNAGTYSVSLKVVGLGGTNIVTATNYITVTNYPTPIASFVADNTNGLAPLLVNFTNLSVNATGFTWEFGDGNTSTSVNPSNTYSNAGTYSVTLIAAGLGGTNSVTFTNYVTVTNAPPPPVVADFVANVTGGLAPLSVNFTNLSANATEFAWDFGDGNTSTNTNPSNTYSNAGSYSVTLFVMGPGGTNSVTFTNYITVTNAPPPPVVADFVADVTGGLAPLSVNFTNLSTGATEFAWDFGDGNTSTNINPANTYTNAGNYSVTLIAVGLGGTNSVTATNYITVTNAPPPPVVADFITDVTGGLAPLSVSFTNLSTGATEFAWDFGDGNTSTNINPANTYTNAGSYSVSLMAVGLGGTNLVTVTNYITVTNAPPPPMIVDFTADATNGLAPLTVTFTNLSANATDFAWDFGDGNTSTNQHPSNTYSNAGSYTVTLTAVGPGGTNSLAHSQYMLVTNLPPLLSVTPSSLNLGTVLTGMWSQASFVISNVGDSTLTATAAITPDPFVLLDENSNSVAGVAFAVPPLAATNVAVRFLPASEGSFSNVVVFLTDGGNSTNTVIGFGLGTPVIIQLETVAADFMFSFATVPGKTYDVQYKDSLDATLWQTLQFVPGDGTLKTITNLTSAPAERYYRLSVQ